MSSRQSAFLVVWMLVMVIWNTAQSGRIEILCRRIEELEKRK